MGSREANKRHSRALRWAQLSVKLKAVIRQASVRDISHFGIRKHQGLLVVITQYYPRFLKRELVHEYVRALAPQKQLLHDFKDAEKAAGDHDLGFESMQYESRFELSPEGWAELERLVQSSKTQDVYFVCHCLRGQYCHRELVMILARDHLGAEIAPLSHAYTVFQARSRAMVRDSL